MDKTVKRIGVAEARATLAEIVNEVAYTKRRVLLVRHGKSVAALVSVEDLEKIQGDKPVSAKEQARRLAVVKKATGMFAHLDKGQCWSEELIAERREEARREDAE